MIEVAHSSYTEATLCFPIRGDEVLVAEKQKKIGKKLLNGFGGKREVDDKDIYATNAREVEEEIGIRVTAVKKVGEIIFHNPSNDPELKRLIVHIFIATDWEGEPIETKEMKVPRSYKTAELDYNEFLPGDRLFMPLILGGKCVKGFIEYDKEEDSDAWFVKSSHIEEAEGFCMARN